MVQIKNVLNITEKRPIEFKIDKLSNLSQSLKDTNIMKMQNSQMSKNPFKQDDTILYHTKTDASEKFT